MLGRLKEIFKHSYYGGFYQRTDRRHKTSLSESNDFTVLREIAIRRKTDTLLNTVLVLDIGFTTGSGYFLDGNESQKADVMEWIRLSKFDDAIYQISQDLLSSGNCFFRLARNDMGLVQCQVLPLDSVHVIGWDNMGLPNRYSATINNQSFEMSREELTHATWRKQANGYGVGIASVAASRGAGYYSNSGLLVRKQNYFETREGILDLSLKAFASSLPRYLATTTNANEESVNKLAESLSVIEPLSSLAVSDDVSIQEMSLNSRTKIDAMIQVLNQEDVSALASPIQQMWSLKGHSWAAARESVKVMMPFLRSFELSVQMIINEIFRTVFPTYDITIKFGGVERPTIQSVKEIVDIVNSNDAIRERADPDKIFGLLKSAGIDLERDG